MPYPRTGTLGGCTVHFAMIVVYPNNSDWDYVADITGEDSWHSDNMRRYFERLARCEYVDPTVVDSRHGFNGWLSTSIAIREWLQGKAPYASNGVAIGPIKRSLARRPEPDPFIFRPPRLCQRLHPRLLEAARTRKELLHPGLPEGPHHECGRSRHPAHLGSARRSRHHISLLRGRDRSAG